MPYDLRTKPIEAGLAHEILGGDTRVIDYQPGNGTRYVLTVTDLSLQPQSSKAVLGYDRAKGLFLVTRMGRGHDAAMLVAGQVHWKAVREAKLAVGVSDAVVLAEVIGYLTGFESMSCEEFEKKEGVFLR
jgi:hypothetical protein